MKYPECKKCVKTVVPALFLGNLTLAILKTVVGVIGNSAGLIADGAHSATDAVSSAVLYVGIKYSDKPADENHPYGHRNIEFIIAKVVSIFLLLVGISILFSAIYNMTKGQFVTPEYITLVTAILSVIANLVMYRYGHCVGTQLNSPAILSVAYEIRADALSSIAIAIGIVCAEMGYPALDPIAAGVISLLIIRNSISMLLGAMDGLMDASVDEKIKRKMNNIISRNPDVVGVDFLRTRRMGRNISLEAGIKIEAAKTVEEADNIRRELRGDLMYLIDNLKDIQISISSAEPDLSDEPGILGDREFNTGIA